MGPQRPVVKGPGKLWWRRQLVSVFKRHSGTDYGQASGPYLESHFHFVVGPFVSMANVSLSPLKGDRYSLWVKVRLRAYHDTSKRLIVAALVTTGPICVTGGAASLALIYQPRIEGKTFITKWWILDCFHVMSLWSWGLFFFPFFFLTLWSRWLQSNHELVLVNKLMLQISLRVVKKPFPFFMPVSFASLRGRNRNNHNDRD